jgi:hypothetical protein
MYATDFIEAFIEIYNVCAAIAIIFFCGLVLFKTHKIDRNLLKAKLFLNDTITERIWVYLSIAGASFALNTLLKFVAKFTAIGYLLSSYYIIEITQVIFLMAFILAIYNWYLFIGTPNQSPMFRRE